MSVCELYVHACMCGLLQVICTCVSFTDRLNWSAELTSLASIKQLEASLIKRLALLQTEFELLATEKQRMEEVIV